MKRNWFIITFWMLSAGSMAWAGPALDFSLHKLESGRPGNTLLVVGGIQGDEPGGFNAASLLVTHYTIKSGSVWVVPNMNFISIVKRSRGIYGDLNRKFATIPENDPEFKAIAKIKQIITDPSVDAVLNLHDGSGFYRKTYIDKLHNPYRWGQCIIIDQEQINSTQLGNQAAIADTVVTDVNRHLMDDEHALRIMNTRTREGNPEMEKTLTYFAIQNRIPAFGLEASKTFPTHIRAYYHLRMLESFMQIMGIRFERRFTLASEDIRQAIDKNVRLAFFNRKIFLDMHNARNRLRYVPFKRNAAIEFTPSNPLIAVLGTKKEYRVFHGNRRVSNIHPQYFEYDTSLDAITMHIDGREQAINFGQMVGVDRSFTVLPEDGYRVNVIGYMNQDSKEESGVPIRLEDIQKRFSVDKDGMLYRVEVYRGKSFTGMVLVNFDQPSGTLTATEKLDAVNVKLAQNRRHQPQETISNHDLSQGR